MRTLLISAFALLVLGFAPAEVELYDETTASSNGKYTSYWDNGKKKAEGEMKMNMRSGEWNLWDSTGTLLMKRFYTDGVTWTLIYPAQARALSANFYMDTVRGSNYFFRKILPDSVIQSFRMWTYVPSDKENPMFVNHRMLDTLIGMRMRGEMLVGDDDEFITPLSLREFAGRLDSSVNRELLGYRIKEDWFYDHHKQSGIFAVLAVCPVLKAPLGDSLDLGWFLFDDVILAKLATMKFEPAYFSEYPKMYDELFFQRTYTGTLYKFTNVHNKTIAELYPDENEQRKEAATMQRAPFEWEHDHWVEYYSKNQKTRK